MTTPDASELIAHHAAGAAAAQVRVIEAREGLDPRLVLRAETGRRVRRARAELRRIERRDRA